MSRLKLRASLPVLLGLVLGLLCSARAHPPFAQETPFSKPEGPYPVGTTNFFWIDETRGETITRDEADKRHLLVQVWYPARTDPSALFAPYVLNPEEFGTPTPQIRKMLSVKTNAILDARVADDRKSFSVIVFSSGMGMPRFSSTFLMEGLASRGFVVFAIGHSFFDGTVVFPDGYRPGQDFYPGSQAASTRGDTGAGYIPRILDIFQKDAEFVLARIDQFNETPGERFYQKLDLSGIGICGWSIGGIHAANMCKNHPRFRAGINFDGLVGGDVVKGGIDKPFLVMKSGISIPENMKTAENDFLGNSTQNVYRLTISGAVHTSFSDMGLFNSSMKGEIDTRSCFAIINQVSEAFFSRYIRMDTTVDLERVVARYPEATLEKF